MLKFFSFLLIFDSGGALLGNQYNPEPFMSLDACQEWSSQAAKKLPPLPEGVAMAKIVCFPVNIPETQVSD